MTTTTQPATVSLTILGPNGTSDVPGSAAIHVHAAGCRDIVKARYRVARLDAWTEDFSSVQDLVTTIYPERDFEWSWSNESERSMFVADVDVFDCVTWPEPGAVVTIDVPDEKPLDASDPIVQDDPMTTTPKTRRNTATAVATFECVVCHHDLPENKFPTVHRKDGIHRGDECRKCRDFRLEGRAIGRPANVVRPGAEPTKPTKAGYRGGQPVAADIAA